MPDASWFSMIDRWGFPSVALIVLVGLLIAAGRWIAINMLTPVTKAHIDFLGKITATVEKQEDTLRLQSETLAGIKGIVAGCAERNLRLPKGDCV